MTTPIFMTGFEYGMIDIPGGGLANSILGSGLEVNTTPSPRHGGSYSLFTHPTTIADGQIRWTNFITSSIQVGRLYLRIQTAPSLATEIAFWDTNQASEPQLYLNPVSVKLELRWGGGSAVDLGTYTLNKWHRVDWHVDLSSSTNVVKARLDGGTEATTSLSQSAGVLSGLALGTTTDIEYNILWDDIIVSNTSGDYPIGPGEIRPLKLTADGAHSPATPDCLRGGGASPALISGSNVAYQYLDDVPFPNGPSPTTDRISQDASASPHDTHYVEVTFADVVENIFHGVVAWLAYGGDAVAPNNGSAKIVRSDATEVTLYSGDMSETTVFYKRAVVTAPVSGWTRDEINALKARVGYSTDANPNPFWQALLGEYACYRRTRLTWDLISSTQADAQEVCTAIENDDLALKEIETDSHGDMESESDWRCVGDVVFSNEVDARNVYQAIINKWTSGPLAAKILSGSLTNLHRCPHPEGESSFDCGTDPLAIFEETVKA